MKPHSTFGNSAIYQGDCIEVMRTLPDNSVDSICTDPPYGLGFMGKKWDALPPGEEWAIECLRVLKPGGHVLAFGGTRTWHRLAVAVEDAGFEIRDSIAWMYGSGFPKSLDVSKAIDKAAGAEREVIGIKPGLPGLHRSRAGANHFTDDNWEGDDMAARAITAPATPAAQEWQGWGTALKPAFEPVVVARKPFPGTVASNVQTWGTGALNINATRIGFRDESDKNTVQGATWFASANTTLGKFHNDGEVLKGADSTPDAGRWPANVVLDETTAEMLDQQSGVLAAGKFPGRSATQPKFNGSTYANGQVYDGKIDADPRQTDSGGASRFFYVARKDDRCLTSQPSSIANTAAESSQPRNLSAVTALSDAATSAHPDTEKPTGSHSTNDTQPESKPNGPSNTGPMTPTGSESLPGQQLADTTPNRNLASSAANQTLTGTTTTMTSHSTSGGSAENTISSTMQPSKEPGDTVSDLRDDARFMYAAKAPKKERPVVDGVAHPTVKPLALMRWLVRLVTPPGGTVLEPFAGSGATVEACMLEGFNVIAIEQEADYLPLIQARIDRAA